MFLLVLLSLSLNASDQTKFEWGITYVNLSKRTTKTLELLEQGQYKFQTPFVFCTLNIFELEHDSSSEFLRLNCDSVTAIVECNPEIPSQKSLLGLVNDFIEIRCHVRSD